MLDQNLGHSLMKVQSRNVVVPSRIICANKLRQCTDHRLTISFKKEDVGTSCGKNAIPRVSILRGELLRNPHLMHTSMDNIICQPLKGVANIDGDFIRGLSEKGKKLSGVVAVFIFQPTASVLEQQSDDSKISVRPSPSSLTLIESSQADRRVIIVPQFARYWLTAINQRSRR